MARISPFRGTLYDRRRVSAAEVFAPPYDVVSPDERAALAALSPYNSIHVELPVASGNRDPYAEAAARWQSWHEDQIVEIGGERALYPYRMTFRDEDGSERSSHGLLCALEIDLEGKGNVLPHEQTTPKDTRDRLELLEATRTNFSPIWGLSLTDGLGSLCREAAGAGGEPFSARDNDSVLHECWTVTDNEIISRAVELVARTPVLIADGHHRYETAGSFARAHPEEDGACFLLALIVELSPADLAIRAIHRLISGVSEAELLDALSGSFDIAAGPREPLALRDELGVASALGLVLADGSFLLHPRDEDQSLLDSERLAQALSDLAGVQVAYQHGASEVADAVSSGRAEAAVLLRPVSIEAIEKTAHGGRRMPPKSTFFYPKPRTGAVFRELGHAKERPSL